MCPKVEFSYASFLIRLWRQTGPLKDHGPREWQSEVEHIQSGQRWSFNTIDGLLDFMRQQAEGLEEIKRFISGFE